MATTCPAGNLTSLDVWAVKSAKTEISGISAVQTTVALATDNFPLLLDMLLIVMLEEVVAGSSIGIENRPGGSPNHIRFELLLMEEIAHSCIERVRSHAMASRSRAKLGDEVDGAIVGSRPASRVARQRVGTTQCAFVFERVDQQLGRTLPAPIPNDVGASSKYDECY